MTGDTHGELDRFKTKTAKSLRKGDSLIVCGDFGFLWQDSKKEQKRIKWLSRRRYKILFVEGTHDNFDLLGKLPEEDFCAARARHVAGNLYQLLRGQVYEIEGKRIFTFGGGESEDQEIREEGINWWHGELPTQDELTAARENLARFDDKVDYIITHQSSTSILSLLHMESTAMRANVLGAFFDWVARKVSYKCWYFGSTHLDKVIPPMAVSVFQEILPIK